MVKFLSPKFSEVATALTTSLGKGLTKGIAAAVFLGIASSLPGYASEPPAEASNTTSGAATLGDLEVRSTADGGYSADRLNELANRIDQRVRANNQQPGGDSPIQVPKDIHVFESAGQAAVGTRLD